MKSKRKYINKNKISRSKSRSRRKLSKKDGVKKGSLLFPLFAASSLLSSPYLAESTRIPSYSSELCPVRTNTYDTDLTFAIKNNNYECAKSLITEYNINEKSIEGYTPLVTALTTNNREMVEYLIKNGADVNIGALESTDDVELLKLLLENGARITYNKRLLKNFKELNTDYIKLFIDYGIELELSFGDYPTPLYIYSLLSGNILNTLDKPYVFVTLVRYLDDNYKLKTIMNTFGIGAVLFLCRTAYEFYEHYIPPSKKEKEKINIKLFKSMKEITEIKNIYNYSFEYSEKFIKVNSILVYLTTMIYFMYKYKDHCSGSNVNVINYAKNVYIRAGEKDFKTEVAKLDLYQLGLTYDVKTKELKGGLIGIKKCLEKNPRFIYIYLDIRDGKFIRHANTVIYDTKFKTMERFEPNGGHTVSYGEIDDKILGFFNIKMGKDFIKEYYKPPDFCPTYCFQGLQCNENNMSKEFDPTGFCTTWCYFYLDMRLKYPDIERQNIVTNMIHQLNYNEKSLTEFIREYGLYLLAIEEKFLENYKGGGEEEIESIFIIMIKELTK